MTPSLGPLGVWARHSAVTPDLAAALEPLGYSAVWLGGSPDADLAGVEALLDATQDLVVATGIVNIWTADAREVAASFHRITGRFPGRFVLGVGVGHPEAQQDYSRPYGSLVDYVDVLDAEGVPSDQLVLAALGDKVLRLAAERSAGAHPYLVPPEHTAHARQVLGAGPLLAPEQKIVVDADPDAARALGRPAVANPYLGLTNYTSNLRRLGWGDDDLADGGSDALIDALVGHGDAPVAAARVRAHLDAGADHVAVQLLTPTGADPVPTYRALAAAVLTGGGR